MSNKEANIAKHVEIILTDISGRKHSILKSFVLPGHLHVKKSEVVELTALETSATLIFPNGNLFGTTQENINAGQSLQLTVNPQAESGSYSYSVITHQNNDLASGGSFPRFIVE